MMLFNVELTRMPGVAGRGLGHWSKVFNQEAHIARSAGQKIIA